MPDEHDFDELLGPAQSGAEWAIEVLFRRYHPGLIRYLRARDPGEAEDLSGEVWLAVARGLPGFRGGEADFRAWLYTIARRQVVGSWRRRSRRRTAPAPVETFLDRPAADEPETAVLDALSGDNAARVVARELPKDQAEVVLLRVVAGLTVEEVARVVGKRPGAVRVLQHRALRRLAERLGRDLPESNPAAE